MASVPCLKSRLLSIEKDFISSVVGGEDAILAFNDRWERLVQDVDATLELTGLDDETASLVHLVASRVATLADISADIYTSYNDFTAELVEQIDSMMSELKLVDAPCAYIPPSSPEFPSLFSSPGVCGKRRRAPSPSSRPKRPRTAGTVSSTETTCSPLPPSGAPFSPAYTTRDTCPDDSSHTSTPSFTSTSVIPAVLSGRRKRRLSDADASGPPIPHKRPHTGPRLHAVSDSFVAYHTTNKNLITRPPSPTISACPLVTSDITIPLEIQSVDEHGAVSLSEFDTTSYIQISNIDTNWLDSVIAPVPPQDIDGLDIFLDSLLDPIHPSNGLTSFDSLASRSTTPLLQSWSTALLAPATPPLDADEDHPDSPSTVAFSLSRPITPALGCASALNDCATIILADSIPLCENQGDVLTNLPWCPLFGHLDTDPWLPTSSSYPAPVAGGFDGLGNTAGLCEGTALPLYVQTPAVPSFAEVGNVVKKDMCELVPRTDFVV